MKVIEPATVLPRVLTRSARMIDAACDAWLTRNAHSTREFNGRLPSLGKLAKKNACKEKQRGAVSEPA